MKKPFGVLLLIGALLLLYFAYLNPASSPTSNSKSPTSNFSPDPSNAIFTFDDGPVTLSNGKNEKTEFGFVEETALLEDMAYGDLNEDDKLDTAVLLVRSGGASGVFVYAAAYVSGPVGYRGSNAVFLGDRISPQSISISNNIVTVRYLDRSEDEPFSAEPTVSASKQFIFRNGEFEER